MQKNQPNLLPIVTTLTSQINFFLCHLNSKGPHAHTYSEYIEITMLSASNEYHALIMQILLLLSKKNVAKLKLKVIKIVIKKMFCQKCLATKSWGQKWFHIKKKIRLNNI